MTQDAVHHYMQQLNDSSTRAWRSLRQWADHLAEVPVAEHARERLGQAATSLWPISHAVPMPPAIQAERRTMRTRRGQSVSYYDDRHASGRPLVLLHSVNACASAYEVKPLFDHFRRRRPVYALDLSGFGSSDRDARSYSPELYTEELVDWLTRVQDQTDTPDVVALSLTGEFAASAAVARKDLVNTLTIISPTGLDDWGQGHRPAPLHALGAKGALPSQHWWSQALFDAIVSRPSIDYFLRKAFVGPVDPGLAAYAYASAHQPGAAHAPLAFLSGRLFTPGILDVYAHVTRPVLALYDQDPYTRFDRLPELLARAPMWAAERVAPSRGLPHFERLDETVHALARFWRLHDPNSSPESRRGGPESRRGGPESKRF
jgi:pimeloyl-ACP methyl ester carboxylesterase